jgi:60Kd inner membrane protein
VWPSICTLLNASCGKVTDQHQHSSTSRTCILRSHTIPSRQQPIYQSSFKQVRSISLWGWSSSASKDADFAKSHTPLGHDGQVIAQQVTASSQRIPAVHQTSDLPPPTSTNPEPQPIPTPPEPTFSPIAQPIGNLDAFPPALTDALDPAQAFSAVPERIGYLKEVCGLDFGWGSSTMMQWTLEHIHMYGDVGWGTSIVLLAALARLLLFYPAALASHEGAKSRACQAVLTPVRQRMTAAWKTGDHAQMTACKAELNVLNKKFGLKIWKLFIPILIQVPLQFGGFRVLRNMAELPVPALEQENWLWAQDLTLGDPFYIIPIANSVIMYLTIKVCISSPSATLLHALTLRSEVANPAPRKSTAVSCSPSPTPCPACPSSS